MLSPRGNVIRLLRHAVRVRYGSWACQNALPQRLGTRRDCAASCFSGFDYAWITAIRGWMPMMFITRVRL